MMVLRKKVSFGLLGSALLLTFFISRSLTAREPASSSSERILLKFKPTVSNEAAKAFLEHFGARSQRVIANTGVHVLELPPFANEAALIGTLRSEAEVEFAELDRMVRPSTITPNDPYFYNQPLSEISVPSAWDTTTGSSAVVIAFVDTGVDSTHEDLASKIVSGWNVYNNNSDTSDAGNGHGTWSAGTAAEITNNGLGAAGVCWNCRIMPVRVSDSTGWASMSNIASGITWAADHGARIVNIGFGVDNDPTVMAAAQYLQSRGGVAIAASGNDGLFSSSPDNPYIITVSAIGPFGVPSYANTGNNLDLVAPACNWVATPPGKYYSYSACGTSISSAFVAGVAGLMVSWKPSLTPADITRALQQSADDKGAAGWDSATGWGEVNAARALGQSGSGGTDTTAPSVSVVSPANGAMLAGTVTLSASASDNVGVSSVSFSVAGSTVCTTTAPYSCNWNSASIANGGYYTLTATARDAAGNTNSSSISVWVNNAGDTTPPTISITAPGDGSTVSGPFWITANATDNVGVNAVQVTVDGNVACGLSTAPWSCYWNSATVPNGWHTIQATAWDAVGNGAVSTVSVYSNNADSIPPSISITSPGDGATVSGLVTISVYATDNVGVSSVQIRVDGNAVCGLSAGPWSCSWDSTKVTNATHSIQATAWDAVGNGANSSSISVTVSNTVTNGNNNRRKK
jgi:subtilase family protein/Big-like domain-containing protein/fervidolysin-like protein